MENEVRVAVLEEKVDHFDKLLSKLDSAIEKIAEVNNNVSRMLAVHEEKISKREDVDDVLFDKVDKLRDKVNIDNEFLSSRVSALEKKLWTSIGILGLVLIATNPSSLDHVKDLMSSANSAMIAAHAKSVDGLR